MNQRPLGYEGYSGCDSTRRHPTKPAKLLEVPLAAFGPPRDPSAGVYGQDTDNRRSDGREQAREYLVTATTMYREMGMTYWLEKTDMEVEELG